jgi:predicted DNA-binding antitoxin AbrB/MazE fold protein
MSDTVTAVYEHGTLVLDEPLSIPEGSKVEIAILTDEHAKARRSAEILARLSALPLEGKTDKFSGRDHDKVLYGEDRTR